MRRVDDRVIGVPFALDGALIDGCVVRFETKVEAFTAKCERQTGERFETNPW